MRWFSERQPLWQDLIKKKKPKFWSKHHVGDDVWNIIIIGWVTWTFRQHALLEKKTKKTKKEKYIGFFTNFLFVLDTHDFEEECNSHLL